MIEIKTYKYNGHKTQINEEKKNKSGETKNIIFLFIQFGSTAWNRIALK